MNVPHSDAFVFFGATGDLAYKKIFPSLQAMIKRGHLNVPVIGVNRAGLTKFLEHSFLIHRRRKHAYWDCH